MGLKPSRTCDYLKQLVNEGVLEVEYKNRKYRIKK
jgi:DNA-binding IclR family transcriptional regulator